jgi:fructose-bisphosphate aldolase class II
MPLTTTAELLASAPPSEAIGAFNVITLEHVEAVIRGAERMRMPVILQLSENAIRFHSGQLAPLAHAATAAAHEAAVPVALHLDHVTDVELLRRANTAGISSVMFDAGAAPYSENVSATRGAADWAHENGLLIEAELGYIGGKPNSPVSAHAAGARTDPLEASAYVQETGVDALAVAVGSSHAMVTQTATIDLELVTRLASAVPVPLVLHGSSGVSDAMLASAVSAGIRKVNVGTALNIAFTAAIRRVLDNDSTVVDPRKYLELARNAAADVVADVLGVISRRPD